MRFWDASAVLAILANQPASRPLEKALSEDSGMVVWWGTRVECMSGLCRLRREGILGDNEYEAVVGSLNQTLAVADEIEPSEVVRTAACRLFCTYPLKAADALQLAAAVVWANYKPSASHGFVCLDQRLRRAAAAEGFGVLPDTI